MNEDKFKYSSIKFDAKPDAVPFNYRLSYKIGQLCLIIASNYKGGTSLYKIHMLSIAMLSEEGKNNLLSYCLDEDPFFVIRFDPSVNRTILFSLFEGLIIQQKNGLFKLTKKGKLLTSYINDDQNICIKEKLFLSQISSKLNEDKIVKLRNEWSNHNAKN